MLRSIRIRAQENAIYTRNYNRMRFIISPDGMSTDLSQSYLAFKLNVVNGKTNEPYTNDEIKNLVNNKIMFAFADSVGEAYSPACMIKTARLFYKGQPIEEIQYSNCLSQTLKQFQSDFETLASESIMSMNNTGMLLNGSLAASTSSYFGASESLTDQAVQVNIPLKDLFGVCRSNNFWIDSEVLIELELEDTKNLIQQSCVADLTSPLPEKVIASTTTSNVTSNVIVTGFTSTNPTNHLANLCPTQNLFSATSRSMASLYNQTEKKISTPQCYRFGSEYISSFFPSTSGTISTTALVAGTYYRITDLGGPALTLAQWNTAGWLNEKVLPILGDYFKAKAPVPTTTGQCIVVNSKNQVVGTPGATTATITLGPKYQWTAANFAELQLKVGETIKLVFKISQAGHVDRLFEFYSLISAVNAFTSGAVPATIVFGDTFAYPIFDGELTNATVELDSFELIPNSGQIQLTPTQYKGIIENNILTGVPIGLVVALQQAGVLSGGTLAQVGVTINHLTAGQVFFNAAISVNSTVSGQFGGNNVVCIYPDLYESADVPSMRRLYSNQGKKLPTQQGLLRIVKATKNATTPTLWDLHFHTAGLENNNSLQAQNLQSNFSGATVLSGLKKVAMVDAYLTIFNSKLQQTGKSGSYMVPNEWYGIASVGTVPSGATKNINQYWQDCGNTSNVAAVDQSFLCRAPMPENVSGATVVWLQANRTHADYAAKTWEIPKAEVILVQRERDPQMPPSPVYSTFRCEAFTIENKLLTDFQRQFIVSERDCFNLLLVTPNYTADSDDKYPETLISKSHNINNYRWSINNIDDTNRAIVIKNNTSSAPSTLHLDKLMDTMKNDAGGLMSMSGINGVWRSVDPPVVFPLKIYTAIDAEMNYLSGLGGYTVQFSAVGDSTHNMYIQPGACFLFKQCFKTLP